MKTLAIVMAVLPGSLAAFVSATAQSHSEKAANCSTYARNRAESEGSMGGGALSGGLRGGPEALFSAPSSTEAKELGAGIGAVRGGVRSGREREARCKYYYDACMRGDTY